MAVAKTTASKTPAVTPAPSKWDTAEVLDGIAIVDKAELVGQRFLITNVWLEKNSTGIEYAYVDGEKMDGSTFTFNDASSTGIKAQLIEYLEKKSLIIRDSTDSLAGNYGVQHPMSVIIPNGLRVSTYSVEVDSKPRNARTYYLTTSGKRAA